MKEILGAANRFQIADEQQERPGACYAHTCDVNKQRYNSETNSVSRSQPSRSCWTLPKCQRKSTSHDRSYWLLMQHSSAESTAFWLDVTRTSVRICIAESFDMRRSLNTSSCGRKSKRSGTPFKQSYSTGGAVFLLFSRVSLSRSATSTNGKS